MERLKAMKESLMTCAQSQMGNLQNVDAKELGEVIDMIKDMEEAIYYCSVVKAMEERKEESEIENRASMYYRPMYYPTPYYMDTNNRMYYTGNGSNSSLNGSGNMSSGSNSRGYDTSIQGNNARGGGSRGYDYRWDMYPTEMRDYREGRSPITRRNYMESKELNEDKTRQMEELDKYAKELTSDIMEMINDATPEEREMLSQKLITLANKIK